LLYRNTVLAVHYLMVYFIGSISVDYLIFIINVAFRTVTLTLLLMRIDGHLLFENPTAAFWQVFLGQLLRSLDQKPCKEWRNKPIS